MSDTMVRGESWNVDRVAWVLNGKGPPWGMGPLVTGANYLILSQVHAYSGDSMP